MKVDRKMEIKDNQHGVSAVATILFMLSLLLFPLIFFLSRNWCYKTIISVYLNFSTVEHRLIEIVLV